MGGILTINGAQIGKELNNYPFANAIEKSDGSCIIIVLTDAPLDSRQLERVAKRAMMGLAKTGGIASNGSGDYVIAASTSISMQIPDKNTSPFIKSTILRNEEMSPVFLASIEATEEAIINSLFMAEPSTGNNNHNVQKLPIDEVIPLLKKYGVIK